MVATAADSPFYNLSTAISHASCATHFMQLLRRTKRYRAQKLPTQTKFGMQNVWARSARRCRLLQPVTLLQNGAVRAGWANRRASWVHPCVYICAHHIVLPAFLGQLVCKSRSGGGDTVTVRPNILCGAVWRTLSAKR